MLLSHKTSVKLTDAQSNIIGHMCYAAYKLWNVCNYERLHHEELGIDDFPNWYYQKKVHKDGLWYKQLPAQSAQEVCKLLDKSWKSYFQLRKTSGVMNPQPPHFKKDNMPITYMQMGVKHEAGSSVVRLSLPKQLKEYMRTTYGICDNFLSVENIVFRSTDTIKQIKLYPPEHGECKAIIVYEVPDMEELPDNGHYLAIDAGLHNLMTCYDSDGSTFIAGRKYLSITRYFDKEIARVQSRWYSIQARRGVKHPKSSTHIRKLYEKKTNAVKDYLHKVTTYVANYCVEHEINTLIIGDLTGIRKDNDLGSVTNQKLHGLPYQQLYTMLRYKCVMRGIKFVLQNEAYSSQCSPLAPAVSKGFAVKSNRIKRGLYVDGNNSWNADTVGAYNILRLYNGYPKPLVSTPPVIVKVAV